MGVDRMEGLFKLLIGKLDEQAKRISHLEEALETSVSAERMRETEGRMVDRVRALERRLEEIEASTCISEEEAGRDGAGERKKEGQREAGGFEFSSFVVTYCAQAANSRSRTTTARPLCSAGRSRQIRRENIGQSVLRHEELLQRAEKEIKASTPRAEFEAFRAFFERSLTLLEERLSELFWRALLACDASFLACLIACLLD